MSPQRCFFIVPHGVDMHLPSDLIGVQPLRYVADRRDRNLQAALGPACNAIRHVMRSTIAVAPIAATTVTYAESPEELAVRLVAAWRSEPLTLVRATLNAGIPFHASDDQDGHAPQALTTAFNFLNSVADGVIAGQVDESIAVAEFGSAVVELWQRAFAYFVPLGVDPVDAWAPTPPIGVLAARWAR